MVSRAIRQDGGIEEVLLHTGQHYDANMSDVFFEELELPAPKYNLGVGSGSHAVQTARMLEGLDRLLITERPDAILIYGDTNSTLAAAVVASKLNIPIAHVEAGLRSFNRRMPEEVNRIVADALADLLFVPTCEALNQLRREGVPEQRIVCSGDVMYDAALFVARIARERSRILESLGLKDKRYLLATVHRAENTDDPIRLRHIFEALTRVARELTVVLPLHPRTRAALEFHGLLADVARRLRLIDPVGFVDMVRLEMGARAIASDSGGLQKEAFFHGVPCFILRNETEWVELVDAGWNVLVPPVDPRSMAETMLTARTTPQPISPYGDGRAGRVIVESLLTRYGA